MDIRQIIEEKRDIFKAMDLAIDNTLNVQDAQMRKEGRLELDKLRGKDPAAPFFIGYAYEFEYDCSKDTEYAQKAIEEYNNLLNYEYAFLHANIERLKLAINGNNIKG